ncbi:MAG: EAL domain-containing protein [Clostridium sp.]
MYTKDIDTSTIEDKEIENIMYQSLNNREFIFYLQPKHNLNSLEISGAEALVRWLHPTKGILSPYEFIPLFERNGFIINLDIFIFEEVCKKIFEWEVNGVPLVPISVNISRLHLKNPNFIDEYRRIINIYKTPPSLIEIEITESAVFDNMDILLSIMKEFKLIGFKISMDDFGTGYSSLNMLREIPVDVLKLDRDFLSGGHLLERTRIVIQGVMWIAKKLDIVVVSEGVETKEQVEFLKEIGCPMAQGYYFNKPMPVHEFEEKLLNYIP